MDFVCIGQDVIVEKELVVPNMGTLYDTAAVTYAFPRRGIVLISGQPYCREHESTHILSRNKRYERQKLEEKFQQLIYTYTPVAGKH